MKIIQAADYADMSRKAANILSAQIILFPRSVLGLATGATPLGIYHQLIEWYRKGDVNFSEAYSVNLDEYCALSPDNEQSYHYYMRHNFFDHINLPDGHIHIPDGTAEDYTAECMRYDNLITALGGIDLQLLGLGHTGHIGFNEPDASFGKMTHRVTLAQKTIDANARFFKNADEVPRFAITLGIRAIMHAKKILLVASGTDKGDILERALFGPITPAVPASILQLHPEVVVVADSAALKPCVAKHPEQFER